MNGQNNFLDLRKIYKYVPPIAPADITKSILYDIKVFYSQKMVNYQIRTDFSSYAVKPIPPEVKKFKQDKTNPIKFLTAAKDSSVFDYLEKHPELCPIGATFFPPQKFFSIYKPWAYGSFVSFAIFAENAELLKYALFNMKPPKGSIKKPDRTPYAIRNIKSPRNLNDYYINFDKMVHSLKPPIATRLLASATAMTASDKSVFLGAQNAMIFVFPVPLKTIGTSPYTIYINTPPGEPYSLCFVDGDLLLINEDYVQIVDPITGAASKVPKKPTPLEPPAVSDGHYIYCLKARSSQVLVFERTKDDFDLVRKVDLKIKEWRTHGWEFEYNIPYSTNGAHITFADAGMQRCFSLANGIEISAHSVPDDINILAWTSLHFEQKHIILTNTECISYELESIIPRWVAGIPFPPEVDNSDLLQSLYFAFFHGMSYFSSSNKDTVLQIFKEYIEQKNGMGIRVALSMLMWMPDTMDEVLTILTGHFAAANDMLRRFYAYIFLHAYDKGYSTIYAADKNNILSRYLNVGNAPELIYAFPSLFDFKTIQVNIDHIYLMTKYIVRNWRVHSEVSSYILRGIINRYCMNGSPEEFNQAWMSIAFLKNRISIDIAQIMENPRALDAFGSSATVRVWGEMIMSISNHRDMWSQHSVVLAETLSFSLNDFVCKKQDKALDFIYRMLTRTFYLFLDILFSAPRIGQQRPFASLEEFYEYSKSPLDKINSELDAQIFNVLAKTYDISEKESYLELFLEIRLKCIFNQDLIPYLKEISSNRMYSAKGVMEYLESRSSSCLGALGEANYMTMLFNFMVGRQKPSRPDHEIILSAFIPRFEERKEDINEVLDSMIADFVNFLRFPVAQTQTILEKADFKMDCDELMNFSLDELKYIKDRRIKLNFISGIERAVIGMFKLTSSKEHNYIPFFNNQEEVYKNTLLAFLSFDNGCIVDIREHADIFRASILTGSSKITESALGILNLWMEKHDTYLETLELTAIDIVSDFFGENKVRFVNEDSSQYSVCIFIILTHLRWSFNRSKEVRDLIMKGPKITLLAVLSSFEAVRDGVVDRFYDGVGVYHSGIICNMNGNSIEVENEGLQETFDLTKCYFVEASQIEPTDHSLVDIDVDLFKSLSKFELAMGMSILERMKDNTKYLEEININNCFDEGLNQPQTVQRLFDSLNRAASNIPDFSFSKAGSDSIEIEGKRGVLAAAKDETFISGRMHPRTEFSLKLKGIQKEESNHNNLVVNVFMETGRKVLTTTSNFPVKNGEEFVLKNIPKTGILEIEGLEYSIPPAAVSIFVTVEVRASQVIRYNAVLPTEIENPFFELKEDSKIFSEWTHYPEQPSPSLIYHRICIDEASADIAAHFKQKIFSRNHTTIKSLVHSNVSVFSERLNTKIECEDAIDFRMDPVDINQVSYINKTAVYVPGGRQIITSSSFVIDVVNKKTYLTNLTDSVTPEGLSIVFPSNCVYGTFVENALTAKCCLEVAISRNMDISKIISQTKEVQQKLAIELPILQSIETGAFAQEDELLIYECLLFEDQLNSESFKQTPLSSRHQILECQKIAQANQFRKGILSMNNSASIEDIKEICDTLRSSPKRSAFLREARIPLCTELSPWALFLGHAAQSEDEPEYETINPDSEYIKALRGLLPATKAILLDALSQDRRAVRVVFVEESDRIFIDRKHSVLVVGKFDSTDFFVKAMMCEAQDFIQSYFSYPQQP